MNKPRILMARAVFPEIIERAKLDTWSWLADNQQINKGDFLDPIQLIPIKFYGIF